MKINALERILFVAGFVLAAGICLGFLFGYRYSFDQHRVEQRGVLVLSGAMDDLTLTMQDVTKRISLPYVDANIPLGRHHVSVNKTGYIPFEADIDVNTEEAVIVPLELAPQLLTGQRQTFTKDTKTDVNYFPGLGVVLHKTASGTLMTHAEKQVPTTVFLPAALRSGGKEPLTLERVSDTQLLVSRKGICMLYNDAQATWKPINFSNKEEILIDQGMVLAYAKTAGTVRYINPETGEPDARPFLDHIANVAPGLVTFVQLGEGYMLYRTDEGNYFRLQPRWFSFPAVEPLGNTDMLHIKNSNFLISGSGSIMNSQKVPLMDGVQRIFVQNDVTFVLSEDNGIYSIEEKETPKFLTRFSSSVLSIQPEQHNIYSFVQTAQALYFCERKTLSRCTELASGIENSLQRGIDKNGRYLWYSDGTSLHIVPFFHS